MADDKHKIMVEILSEDQNTLEKLYHEIHKSCEQAARYGEDVTVTRVQEEVEERGGFE
jgi:organic hydroperoxide reductase OsmC/OhrA